MPSELTTPGLAEECKVHEVQIPSLHDGVLISCRIYALGTRSYRNIAVVGHPYGPLGGSQDDRVVKLTVRQLVSSGYDVATFEFRSRPSWTLKPEVSDYSSVVLLLLMYASLVPRQAGGGATSGSEDSGTTQEPRVLISGYSYGSLVASRVPTAADILQAALVDNDRYSPIYDVARKLAAGGRQTTETLGMDVLAHVPQPKTNYLFISPLLTPTTLFLAPLAKGRAQSVERDHFQNNKSLAIFGTDDTFTSSKRLESWGEEVGIETVVVTGASHFWQDLESSTVLQTSIARWLAVIGGHAPE